MSATVAKTTKSRTSRLAVKPPAPKPVAPAQPTCRAASEDQIRLRAYLLWEAAGRPAGDGAQFWLEAEQELRRGVPRAEEEAGRRFPRCDMDPRC
jgi:hypothetical protein